MTPERTWFGQPRGLTVLFLTNMWEQFSYFGMRALLIYYMTKQLLIADARAASIYGTYTAAAYFTPIIGGIIADRYLGKRRAILIGGSIMALGHFMMAFEPLFFPALAVIALGNGLFLPSLPSQVGSLYQPEDPRRGWAYNVYYVGVNIGGFLAPLLCGTIGELFGWHYGFAVAGVGMLVGLVIYVSGQRYLPPESERSPVIATETRGRVERKLALLIFGFGIAVTAFRAAYEQSGIAVALWADSGVDRHAGSFSIPMTWFQSMNPLFVMLFTPPLLAWWQRRAAAGHVQAAARRMASGALIVAASYLMLAGVAWGSGSGHASWLWLLAYFAVLTIGELLILPTGLGLFARLAPRGFGATAVAAWFFFSFTGNFTSGWVGALWASLSHPVFFCVSAALCGFAALMLITLDGPTARLERDRAVITESD